MKARLVFIGFAAGLGAGWLIFGGMRESAETTGNKSAAPVVASREVQPVKDPDEARFRKFIKELPTLSDKNKDPFNVVNFEQAWAFCRRIESDADRKLITSQFLNVLVETDPNRAFALYLGMVAEDPAFSSNVRPILLRQAASDNATSFIDILGRQPFDISITSAEVTFAKDFDFQQAADGFTAILRKKPENPFSSHPQLPANFLTEWAARDADAALACFAEGTIWDFENFDNLIEGIGKQGNPSAAFAWAAAKLNKLVELGDPNDMVYYMNTIRTLTQSNSDRRPTIINTIAQAMPDARRDRFLDDVVTMGNFINPTVEIGYALTQMSSPERRLYTLQQLGHRLDAEKIPDTQLQQWGLTRQQVEQAQASDR